MYTDNEKSRRGGGSPRLRLGNCGILWLSPGGEPASVGGSRRGGAALSGNVPIKTTFPAHLTGYKITERKHPTKAGGWMLSFLNLSSTVSGAAKPCLILPGQAPSAPGPDRSRHPPYASSARRNAMIFFSSLDTLTCDSPRLSATSCWVMSR